MVNTPHFISARVLGREEANIRLELQDGQCLLWPAVAFSDSVKPDDVVHLFVRLEADVRLWQERTARDLLNEFLNGS
ncbi:MAG TPA: hypothetical protein VJB99_04685 [Patescibacteria group bacterium]|nr:hypothetical protein [Patescibacteria group bacterium]